MNHIVSRFGLAVALTAGLFAFNAAENAAAQYPVVAAPVGPVVTYYRPRPVLRPFTYSAAVSYPTIGLPATYAPVPVTTYFAPVAPVTTYYTPTVAAPAAVVAPATPVGVTTYYGAPRRVTTYYAPPVVAPAPIIVSPW